MATTALYFDPAMLEHDPGPRHPDHADRLRAIARTLDAGLPRATECMTPTAAPLAAIAAVHERTYIDRILALRGRDVQLDPDTHLSPRSVDVALIAAGSAINAVDRVIAEPNARAFGLVRPPGHHALPSDAMGFCVFNNVAVAVAHAKAAHGLARILVLDWDVHHGNGTQAIFWRDPAVLFMSLHQFPCFPGTGAATEIGSDAGAGYTINVPLSPGATDADYRFALEELLVPIAAAYRPELVVISAGFDAHRADPLGQMALTSEGFADLCGVALAIANTHAAGRIALVLEGGYDVAGLSQSVRACIQVLAGDTPPCASRPTTARAEAEIRRAIAIQRLNWRL